MKSVTKEQYKQENKKALKILVPITIAAGVFGGIIGVMASMHGAQGLAETFSKMLHQFLYIIGPWAVILSALIGILGGLYMYKAAQKDYEKSLPIDEDDEIDEEVFTKIDKKISQAILLNSMMMILSFMFYAIVVAYMERYIEESLVLLAVSFIAFIASMFGAGRIQQMLIDFTKVLYPQKNGSVYDIKFSEKWEESCDELEKLMIYKAAYKAYKTTNLACCIGLVTTILLCFFFHYGPLPAMLVGIIWIIHVMTYGLEAMKLENK